MLNSKDIDLLRQDVADNCRLWLERCAAAGLKVLITNTVRDTAYQTWLYEQGRTRPGSIVTNGRVPTFHSVEAGLAFDFCKNVKGHEYDDPAFFRQAAALAKEMGFTWGGDWKSFPDMPHIQWDDGGRYTGNMIKKRQYPPDMPLWKEASEEVTQEQFDNMLEDWLERQAAREPSSWSAEDRAWAEKAGLVQGNGAGANQYQSFLTKEQAIALLRRYCKLG